MESWKTITGYGRYEVSDLGRVRNADGRVLATEYKTSTRGRRKRIECRVFISDGDRFRHRYIARLVAREFCPGYAEDLTVDHLDGDTTNNAAANLEWVTRAENIRRARASGIYRHANDGRWMRGGY